MNVLDKIFEFVTIVFLAGFFLLIVDVLYGILRKGGKKKSRLDLSNKERAAIVVIALLLALRYTYTK